MTVEQKQKLDILNEQVTALQNRCNRAQSSLVQAETAETDEARDRLIQEAETALQ